MATFWTTLNYTSVPIQVTMEVFGGGSSNKRLETIARSIARPQTTPKLREVTGAAPWSVPVFKTGRAS